MQNWVLSIFLRSLHYQGVIFQLKNSVCKLRLMADVYCMWAVGSEAHLDLNSMQHSALWKLLLSYLSYHMGLFLHFFPLYPFRWPPFWKWFVWDFSPSPRKTKQLRNMPAFPASAKTNSGICIVYNWSSSAKMN